MIVAVEVADSESFAALDAAIAILREQPAIATVSYDASFVAAAALPRPPDPSPGGFWGWDNVTRYTAGPNAGSPRGTPTNWGIEGSRFPEAWNWMDAIRARNTARNGVPATQTLVLDDSFPAHPDTDSVLTVETLCKAGQSCTASSAPGSHGLAVSGVIGAQWDRGDPGAPRSQGMTGANPFAAIVGVRAGSFKPTDPNVDTQTVKPVSSFLNDFELILAERAAKFPHLRVINLSMSQMAFGFEKPGAGEGHLPDVGRHAGGQAVRPGRRTTMRAPARAFRARPTSTTSRCSSSPTSVRPCGESGRHSATNASCS